MRNMPLSARRAIALSIAATCLGAVGAPAASATYPGKQGRIAYSGLPGGCASDTDPCVFRRLTTIRPNGSKRRRLNVQGDDPSWSPDGRKLVLVDYVVDGEPGDDSILTMNADASAPRRLTSPADGRIDAEPAWSPKGTTIVFTRYHDDRRDSGDLYFVKADGTGLTKFLDNATSASWSSKGQIAFVRGGDIYRVNADRSALKRLTKAKAEDAYPDWSPRGSKLIFTRGGFDKAHLYTMKSNAKGLRRISKKASRRQNPAWAPDAKRIVFEDFEDIRTANPDGRRGRKVGAGFAPAWGRRP